MSIERGRRRTTANTTAQLSTDSNLSRHVVHTLQKQRLVPIDNHSRNIHVHSVSTAKLFVIKSIANAFLPALGCFVGIGSPPHHLYSKITFDKLHMLDLGLIQPFCGLTNTVIQQNNPLPLSLLIVLLNKRYMSVPPQARLSSHLSFRTTHNDAEAGVSGNIRRESNPFL